MSASRTSLLVLLVFVAGTFIGWQAADDRVAPAPTGGVSLPAKVSRRDMGPTMPPSVQKLLAPVRAARTDDERMRATLALAASIPVDQLAQWYAAGWFGLHGSMESLVFERVTQDRWLEKDPGGLVAYLVRAEHPEASVMAGRWADHDPAGAFAFLRSSNKPDEFDKVASAVMDRCVEKIPQVLADEMPWIFGSFGVSSLVREIVAIQPELIRSRMEGWPEDLRGSAVLALDQADLRKDARSALATMMNEPDGRSRFTGAALDEPYLLGELSSHWALLPPGWFADAVDLVAGGWHGISFSESPERWLDADLAGLGLSEDQVGRMRGNALSVLARSRPEEALRRLEQGLFLEAERQSVVQSSFEALCEQSPERAEELLGQLSDPDEIALARKQIEDARTDTVTAAVRVKSIPEWLATFSSDTDHADESAAAVWDARQAMEATAAFEALPAERKGRIAENLIGEAESEVPPELAATALQYLLIHPPAGEHFGPEDVEASICELANDWGTRDPRAASRWVASLPEGSARVWAAKNLAARWAEYEPAAARLWASRLPVGDRFEVVDYLDSGKAWKE